MVGSSAGRAMDEPRLRSSSWILSGREVVTWSGKMA